MSFDDLGTEEKVNAILEKMEAEDAAAAPVERETPELPETALETAPETASEEQIEGDTQEAPEPDDSPAIAPPLTWKAELKASWAELPPALQRDLAQWEEERNKGVNSKLSEAAELRKAAEAQQQTVTQERQRYAQALDFFINQAQNLDPILAQGQRTDWAKLAQTDPAAYVARKAEFDQRVAVLQNAHAERQQIATQEQQQALQRNQAALDAQMALAAEKIPEWKDEASRKGFKEKLSNSLIKDYGFTEAELQGLVDHRQILICRDAMLYRQMQAAKQALPGKQATAATQRVVRPGSASARSPANAHVKALKSTAIRSGKESDLMSAAMAIIGE